jgi:LuxR family maltose regulon positive regulatory protein
VLDNFSLLRSRAVLETVSTLVDGAAEGSTTVLSGRVPPRIALAPLRARGRLFELGTDELALTEREAHLLLTGTGLQLSESTSKELVDRCEGWAAALYLGALAIRDGTRNGHAPVRVSGDDRYLADYLRSEYVSHLRPGPLRFLRRTAVLDQMCGPLCDAVLDDEGSAQELEKIERANLFLFPLDNRREWYRYHHLLRQLLRRELVEQEPQLVPVLHRRAADWFEAHGDREAELEHAYAGGDTDRAAAILSAIAMSLYGSGRVTTLERWFRRFEQRDLLDRFPSVALLSSGVHLMQGRGEQAARWLETAELGDDIGPLPDGSPSIRPWIAVIRAWMCTTGAKQMLVDARAALADLLASGSALHLLGEDEGAEEAFAAAAKAATSRGADETGVIALSSWSLLLADHGDNDAADKLSKEAHRLVTSTGWYGSPARAIECAASARMLLHRGHWNEARTALTEALNQISSLTDAVPWLVVRTRLEIARGLITVRDGDAAGELIDEVEELCGEYPGLGVLPAMAEALRRELDALPESDAGASSGLTRAELRLLPLLATHLSFREIAEEACVSRSTIKTQAISVYRKLGVSSRSEAISEAHRLGLGDHLRVLIES